MDTDFSKNSQPAIQIKSYSLPPYRISDSLASHAARASLDSVRVQYFTSSSLCTMGLQWDPADVERVFKICHLPVQCAGLQSFQHLREATGQLERAGSGLLQVFEAGEESIGPRTRPRQNFPSSSCLFKAQRNGQNLYTLSLNIAQDEEEKVIPERVKGW